MSYQNSGNEREGSGRHLHLGRAVCPDIHFFDQLRSRGRLINKARRLWHPPHPASRCLPLFALPNTTTHPPTGTSRGLPPLHLTTSLLLDIRMLRTPSMHSGYRKHLWYEKQSDHFHRALCPTNQQPRSPQNPSLFTLSPNLLRDRVLTSLPRV